MAAISGLYIFGENDEIIDLLVDCLSHSDSRIVQVALSQLGLFGPAAKTATDDIEQVIANSNLQESPGIQKFGERALIMINTDTRYTYLDWLSCCLVLNR